MKIKFVPFLFIALLVLQGCTALGLQQPQTFDEKWANAQSQTTGLRDVSTRALDARLITSEQMNYIISTADRSTLLLKVARTAYEAGEATEAQRNLLLVTSVLDELERFLSDSQKEVKP